jgi:membrane protein YqaA with SNARE-associated domain
MLRSLTKWVVSWADSPFGTWALVVVSFADSSVFPVPPDFLQIALSTARPRRSYHYAFVSAVASVLGGVAGWYIGFALWSMVGEWFFAYVPGFTPTAFERVSRLYGDNAFLALLAASFTPLPYKLFTVSAGVFSDVVPLHTLLLASILGRSSRFFLVATAVMFAGPRIKVAFERHVALMSLVSAGLVISGFVAVHLYLASR